MEINHSIQLPSICSCCHQEFNESVLQAREYAKEDEFFYVAIYCNHQSVLAVVEIDGDGILGVSLHGPITEKQADSLMQVKMSSDVSSLNNQNTH